MEIILIPLAILAAMFAYDRWRFASWSRKRKSRAGVKWVKAVGEIREKPSLAPGSEVRHLRRPSAESEGRAWGFFRPGEGPDHPSPLSFHCHEV